MARFMKALSGAGGWLVGSTSGSTGGRGGASRRKRLLLLGAFLGLPLAILLAIHDVDLFELDGDASDGVAAGDDWANVFNGTDSAAQKLFIGAATEANTSACPVASCLDVSYFTGGGSKDVNDIPQWLYSPGDVSPDKDSITDAYAAAYPARLCSNAASDSCTVDGDCPAGGVCEDHEVIYFGADRFSNGGDAQIGFWFFKNDVSLDPIAGNTGTFSGVHSVGDLLVLSDFTQGGRISTIKVYEWVGAGGDTGGGVLDLVVEGVDCATTPGGDAVCGTVNPSSTPSPWPYIPKAGVSGTFPAGSIYEAGLDLSRLGIETGCFSSFLAETRSSQSVSAQLKDFALGAFESCKLSVDKSGPELAKVGDQVTYTIEVTNDGARILYKQSIIDDVLGDLTSDAGCGASLPPGASCTIMVSRTVQAGDPDPLVNTVSIIYDTRSDLTGDEVSASDSHTVNLFQPSVTVDKTGGTLSKVGDSVTYTFAITNTSSADTPTLLLNSVVDDVLGDLTAAATASGCGSLASGAGCAFGASRIVQASDSDPLVNTVVVHYHPDGFTNDIRANDSHSVNLFTPCIRIDKSGDELSKVGDDVNYTIQVTNCSSADTPDLSCTVRDALLGIDKPVSLAPGASDTTNATRAVQAGDPDPLVNTATVDCAVDGFPNQAHAEDSHSVNLFQPGLAIEKTGDALSKVGDDVGYTITVTNTSSADSPALTCTLSDALLGISKPIGLAPGAVDTTNASRAVQAGDPDPLVNTATVDCTVDGFGNRLTASDDHSVNLFQPSLAITKDGDTLSKVGDDVGYTITVTNTSSADSPALTCTLTDALLGISKPVGLAPGASDTTNASRAVQAGDPDPLVNTATVDCTVDGFGNRLTASASHAVNLFQPGLSITKDGDALSKAGDDVNYTITVTNTSSADSPALTCTVRDALLGIDKPVSLAPGASDTTDATRAVQAGDPDPLVNTATVDCTVDGFGNQLHAEDNHSVNLFQPGLAITKGGDTLSKVGDDVGYTITVSNTSSADSPALTCTLTDALLGISKPIGLAPGASDVTNAARTTQAGDPDPLVNTATVDCTVDGFGNRLSASASHSVNLFQPGLAITKDGDTLSKVGDDANYTITVTNTSSADSPALTCTLSDALLGISKPISLAAGASDTTNATRTTQAGDPDPLVNTATADCIVDGFGNRLTASASHSVNLFQPGVTIAKDGDTLSKIGDDVNYTIIVTNTSSADSPDLTCTVRDALLGIDKPVGLAPGASDTTNATRTTQAVDPDPLVNTATVDCTVDGFGNQLHAEDGHAVNLFQPGVDVGKLCSPSEVSAGGVITYTITITNTGSPDSPPLVNGSIQDSLLGDLLAANPAVVGSTCTQILPAGGSCSITATRTALSTDPDTLTNTVNVQYNPEAFPNQITDTASCSVTVQKGCAHSPGFWKGGNGINLWDSPGDPIAQNAGFYTGTVFPWLAPRYAGTTYLDTMTLKTAGDVTIQMAFKYIAARLDEAAFGVSPNISNLLDAIDVYFAAYPVGSDPSGAAEDQGQALLAELNNWFLTTGTAGCPF